MLSKKSRNEIQDLQKNDVNIAVEEVVPQGFHRKFSRRIFGKVFDRNPYIFDRNLHIPRPVATLSYI